MFLCIISCKYNFLLFFSGSHAFIPKQNRQSYLTGKYHFLCECTACANNFPLLTYMVLANIPEIHSNGLNVELDRTVAEDIYRKCCSYLREYYHHYPCKEVYSAQMCLSKILSYLLIDDGTFQILDYKFYFAFVNCSNGG